MNSFSVDIIYYIYIFLYGSYISFVTACGGMDMDRRILYCVLCSALLLLQGACLQFFGEQAVWLLYPLIAHLPIALLLILRLKIRWDAALISVIISYSLCQLPRWFGLLLDAFAVAPALSLLLQIAVSQLLLAALRRYFLPAIHDILRRSPNALISFGALPVLYFLYEYFMRYTQYRFAAVDALGELLPTGLVLFYIAFAIMYKREMEKRESAEGQAALLEAEIAHAGQEIASLRMVQEQTAIYRHDLRHHLMMIQSLLAAGQHEQAAAYIRDEQDALEAISPVRYCENDIVNLLLGAFRRKAGETGASLTVRAHLPAELPLPDTELCAMLSNGLENALNAVSALPPQAAHAIDVYCAVRQSTLLIEIKNPCADEVRMENGIPVSDSGEKRYGCRSIQAIVQRRKGVCTFEAADNTFLLRIAIPLQNAAPPRP